VVSLISGGANAERLRDAHIQTTELGMRPGWPDPRGVWRLARLIRSLRPSIVQSWMYHADLMALAAMFVLPRYNRPRLVWGVRCSDMDVSRYGSALRWTIALCAHLSRRPDALIINSHAGRRAHEAIGYRPRRVEVIPNGIDLERYRPDSVMRAAVRRELGLVDGSLVIAHVARLDAMKDHANLLAALERLPAVTALAIGSGTETLPDRPNLKRLGIRTDVPRLLTACDVIVSTSAFGEGFSNALAEGMATGLIPIATDVGDSRLIAGDVGFVVQPRDPDAIVDAVNRLISAPAEEWTRRKDQARTRIETNFTLSKAADAYMSLYRALG
jgi:glycosyltransferase involved in cell wall biosynthesis